MSFFLDSPVRKTETPYIRNVLVFGTALYLEPPCIWNRLIFRTAFYFERPYIQSCLTFELVQYIAAGRFIFFVSSSSLLKQPATDYLLINPRHSSLTIIRISFLINVANEVTDLKLESDQPDHKVWCSVHNYQSIRPAKLIY